jgi:hypothetical protein
LPIVEWRSFYEQERLPAPSARLLLRGAKRRLEQPPARGSRPPRAFFCVAQRGGWNSRRRATAALRAPSSAWRKEAAGTAAGARQLSVNALTQLCHIYVILFIAFEFYLNSDEVHCVRLKIVTGVLRFYFHMLCMSSNGGTVATVERCLNHGRKLPMHKLSKLGVFAAFAAMLAYSGTALAQADRVIGAAPTSPPKSQAERTVMAHKDAVEHAQEALNKTGADLKVDGVVGHATRAALENFQKSHGLKVTGRLDKETSAALKS